MAVSPSMLLTLKTPSEGTEMFPDTDAQAYGRRRWRRVQVLADTFWRLWKEHYLAEINQRRKWCKVKENLRSGDVVLIRDKAAPRASWRVARVVRIHAGKDGRVRGVGVRHADARGLLRETEKSVHDLVLLFSSE